MPARSRRIYVLARDAVDAGLVFEVPEWWLLDRLFEIHADRRIEFFAGRDVLFVEWPCLLTFNLQTGRKEWDLPERESMSVEMQQQRQELLNRVQDGKWFIIGRERVWIVPEKARAGCVVFAEPPWWHMHGNESFRTWYREFRERYEDRFFEEAVPFQVWLDYTALFTAREMLTLDERGRESYRKWKQDMGQKLSRTDHERMARIAHVLQEATWVVIYDYEWESGLE